MTDFDARSMGFLNHEEFEEWRNRDKGEKPGPPKESAMASQADESAQPSHEAIEQAYAAQEITAQQATSMQDVTVQHFTTVMPSQLRRAEIRAELRELEDLRFRDNALLDEIVYHRINALLDELETLE